MVTLAELLPMSGSAVPDVTWAELLSALTLPTSARMVTVAWPPLASVPIAQLTVFAPLQ